MRLTVGPLPAAVYWRRRAVVLVGLAGIVLIIFYACGGASGSTANPEPGAEATAGAASASPSTELLRPTLPSAASATPGAFTLPTGGPAIPCTDTEMQVVAAVQPSQVPQRAPVELTIKIKNGATRTCSRDIGADVQELRIVQGSTIIWSSDDCNPNRGHDVAVFPPGKEVTFTRIWDGRVSRSGTDSGRVCGTDKVPLPGGYQVLARLDDLLSEPEPLTIMP